MRKVLISPGYGAGWSTWNGGTREAIEYILTYQPIIDFLESGNSFTRKDSDGDFDDSLDRSRYAHPLLEQLAVEMQEKFDVNLFAGGAPDLVVVTLEDDEQIQVNEYDGFESLIYRNRDDDEWF